MVIYVLLRACHDSVSLCVEHNQCATIDVIRDDGDIWLYRARLRGLKLSLTERSLDATLEGLLPYDSWPPLVPSSSLLKKSDLTHESLTLLAHAACVPPILRCEAPSVNNRLDVQTAAPGTFLFPPGINFSQAWPAGLPFVCQSHWFEITRLCMQARTHIQSAHTDPCTQARTHTNTPYAWMCHSVTCIQCSLAKGIVNS